MKKANWKEFGLALTDFLFLSHLKPINDSKGLKSDRAQGSVEIKVFQTEILFPQKT